MTAADRILPRLSGVRARGDGRWIALCPAHDDRSPSLTIRQTSDRVLVRCWAGCTTSDMVAAVGLTLADLYDNRRHYRPNPIADGRCLAAVGLETWRQSELQRCAEELRARDTLRGAITAGVRAGDMTEAEAWDSLERTYRGYTEVEYRFDQLLRNQNTLQMWRESRAPAPSTGA